MKQHQFTWKNCRYGLPSVVCVSSSLGNVRLSARIFTHFAPASSAFCIISFRTQRCNNFKPYHSSHYPLFLHIIISSRKYCLYRYAGSFICNVTKYQRNPYYTCIRVGDNMYLHLICYGTYIYIYVCVCDISYMTRF